jgi:hypothetical protein
MALRNRHRPGLPAAISNARTVSAGRLHSRQPRSDALNKAIGATHFSPRCRRMPPNGGDQRANMARVIFISRKKRNAIFAPLHRLVRQVLAAGSDSYSASRYSYSYSYSRRHSDTPLVRCISRVSIDTIRFRSVLPRQFESSSIASQTLRTS